MYYKICIDTQMYGRNVAMVSKFKLSCWKQYKCKSYSIYSNLRLTLMRTFGIQLAFTGNVITIITDLLFLPEIIQFELTVFTVKNPHGIINYTLQVHSH